MSNLRENSLVTVYKFDEETNIFIGEDYAQVVGGEPLIAPDCVSFAPTLKEGCYYVLNENKDAWIEHNFPKNAEECIGIELEHKRNDDWTNHMRQLFEQFTKDSTEYRIKSDEVTLNKTIEKIPEKTLEELKTEKLTQLQSKQRSFEDNVCSEMKIMSSIGFLIDADIRSQNNMTNLIQNLGTDDTEFYKCGDNVIRPLTVEQLKTMKKECYLNGKSLYTQCWDYKETIEAATTKEEVEAIKLEFTMMDFSSEVA